MAQWKDYSMLPIGDQENWLRFVYSPEEMLGQNLQSDPIVGLKALKQSFDSLYYQLKEPICILSDSNCFLPPNWGSKHLK